MTCIPRTATLLSRVGDAFIVSVGVVGMMRRHSERGKIQKFIFTYTFISAIVAWIIHYFMHMLI